MKDAEGRWVCDWCKTGPAIGKYITEHRHQDGSVHEVCDWCWRPHRGERDAHGRLCPLVKPFAGQLGL